MILDSEVFQIGVIRKPHGVKGEVSFSFNDDVFDRTECEYLIVRVDGILVPFFFEEYRFRSDNAAIVKFEGIDNVESARRLTNAPVFFPIKLVPDDDEQVSWSFFIGMHADDVRYGSLGTIVDVDDSTINVLFVIQSDSGKEILIPANEAFIADIDRENRTVSFKTPDGLLNINK